MHYLFYSAREFVLTWLAAFCITFAGNDGAGRRQRVSPKARLGVIFEMIQEFYSAHSGGTRMTNLKLKMFVNAAEPHQNHPLLTTKAVQ